MNPLFFMLTTLLALAVVHAVPAGQPSSVPTCAYTCPPQDQGGHTLGTHDDNGVRLFCSYPHGSNPHPSDFHCTYSRTTGALMKDKDDGLCPRKAIYTCPQTRRRSALPRAPAPVRVARAPTPDEMKVRALLKRQPVQLDA